MAKDGAIEALIALLTTTHDHIQRQAAKALANLGKPATLLLFYTSQPRRGVPDMRRIIRTPLK